MKEYQLVTDRYGREANIVTMADLYATCMANNWPITLQETDRGIYDKDGLVALPSSAKHYVLELVDWEETNNYWTVDLLCECFNTSEAQIDVTDGSVWLGDATGHWATEEELQKFKEWHRAIDR